MSGRAPLVGIYPGTFDPITLGHMDIISRATKVVDRLIIAVAANAGKNPLFGADARVQMIREEMDQLETNGAGIEVRSFDNLLMHFAEDVGARVILRGLRAVSDFEFEVQLSCMNRRLAPDIETLFIAAAQEYGFVSSSLVREIASLGGDVAEFVHPRVKRALDERFGNGGAGGA